MTTEVGAVRTLDVGLGERTYPIHVGAGLLPRAGALARVREGERAVIVSNATVAGHWLAPLKHSLRAAGARVDTVLVLDGEEYKRESTLFDLLTRLLELGAERRTTLYALGGGVVGDLTGFAAAIYQRGIPFVQVPTTLLAQVDSSVGGKTGINHPLGKNMIGAFWQPKAVLIDVDCLATLPPREYAAGLAEVVKHGAIRDAAFFARLERDVEAFRRRDAAALTDAIIASCAIKAAVVAADERETGERALLNFGHTFGHAIETASGYGAWLHGEAVAAGMVLASQLSTRVAGLPAAEAHRIEALLAQLSLPVKPPALPLDRWLELMARDKKVEAGVIRFVLLEAMGRAVVRSGVPIEAVAAVVG